LGKRDWTLKLLILLHSLDKFAGGVENRTSELELNLKCEKEYLLYKNIVSLPHKGKINFVPTLKIPHFIIKHKHKLKLITYFYGFLNLIYRVYHTRKFIKKK
jgi:hypothetical protein